MYTVKEVCKKTGLSQKAVRYYDNVDLLHPSCRTESGYRLYSDTDVSVLKVIQKFRTMAFSVEEIRVLLGDSPQAIYQLLREKKSTLAEDSKNFFLLSEKVNTLLLSLQQSFRDMQECKTSKTYDTVLLVTNMQNDFIYGSLSCAGCLPLIESIQRVIRLATDYNVPVIYLCDSHQQGRDAELTFWGAHAIEGTPGAQLISALPQPTLGCTVKKKSYSGFFETSLQDTLQFFGSRRIVLCGVYSDLCINQTLIDAYGLGYETYPLRDCIIAKRNADTTETFANWEKFYGAHSLTSSDLQNSSFHPETAALCCAPP